MEIKIINDNDYGENIYIYYDKATNEGVIIDPGDSLETIVGAIKNLKIKGILLTHGHFDHIFTVDKVRELTGAPVYAHKAEAEVLKSSEYNRSVWRDMEISVVADKFFEDGDVFEISDEIKLKIIHTPGHTAGGLCYYDEKNGIMFTGDTLFKETIGRTDMPTGSRATLLKSVREKLFTLDGNVKVFPGHGKSTTVSHEKIYNYPVGNH